MALLLALAAGLVFSPDARLIPTSDGQRAHNTHTMMLPNRVQADIVPAMNTDPAVTDQANTFIRAHDLDKMLGITRFGRMKRMQNDRGFPRPVRFSENGQLYFVKSEVLAYINRAKAARHSGTAS